MSKDPRLVLLSVADKPDAWTKASVLTLDGSADNVILTLLVLEQLVLTISGIERSQHPEARTSADSPLLDDKSVEQGFDDLRSMWPDNRTEQHLESASQFLPCHYFDFIGGSSTGGYAALLLGRLRMSITATIAACEELTRQMQREQVATFGHRVRRSSSSRTGDDKKPIRVENIPEKPLRSDVARCQTIVCAYVDDTQQRAIIRPYCLNSFDTGVEEGFAANITIREVVDVATCNPFEQKWTKVEGIGPVCDVGFEMTNPSAIVLSEIEAQRRHRPSVSRRLTDIFVSLGPRTDTAKKHGQLRSALILPRANAKLGRTLQQTATEVHKGMERRSDALGSDGFKYYRLGPPLDVARMPLGEKSAIKRRARMEKMVRSWLGGLTAKHDLSECAHHLVDLRRSRSRSPRWEAFAFGWSYRCVECPKDTPLTFTERSDLVWHLYTKHDLLPFDDKGGQTCSLADQGRIYQI